MEKETPSQTANAKPAVTITGGFPWLSTVTGLLLVGWFLLHLDPALYGVLRALLQRLPDGPGLYASGLIHPILAALYALTLLFDLRRYVHRRRASKRALLRLQAENRDLWSQRKQLHMKARTYAGHADKLKLFISDKLLEYIEYDEKFLHFQSIAAEVRHNGVIAFDRVQSALNHAQNHRAGDEPPAIDDTRYRDANDQMRYLWDLLDLATTDNLSLHISKLQAQCEERYYQKLLNPDDPEPQSADYSPRLAVWRSAQPRLIDSALTAEQHEQLARENAPFFLHTDPQLRLALQPTNTLLGKPNHLVLLLDNLLKNAQFYAQKRGYKHRHNRVAMQLDEVDGTVRLQVYNRGPHIDAADRGQIFQLGYSTRRVKEHHGKGLGLFFVHEIVQGYDGQIHVHNVDNHTDTWHLRVTLTNGDVVNETVTTLLDGQQLRVTLGTQEDHANASSNAEKSISLSLRQTVTSVTIHQASTDETQTLEVASTDDSVTLFDPFAELTARWAIELHPRKRGCRLVFEPLDLHGVVFEVRLPTAQARLNSTEDSLELDDIDDEMERLNAPFAAQQLEVDAVTGSGRD